MLVLLAQLKVQAGKADEARAAFRDLGRSVKANEPGTLEYNFFQRKDDPLTFLVFERYRDEAAFQAHGANLKQHAGVFASLVDGAPSITFLDEV